MIKGLFLAAACAMQITGAGFTKSGSTSQSGYIESKDLSSCKCSQSTECSIGGAKGGFESDLSIDSALGSEQ